MKIAVLSRGTDNYSTQRLISVAKERGHNAIVVNHAKCYIDIESTNPVVRYEGEDISNIDAIIPRIGPSITKYGSAIVRQFEMMGVYTIAKSIAIVRSRDKLRSIQIMSKANVGIPKTVFSRETNQVEDLLELVGGTPVIVKLAKGTHGRGVVLAETNKAAKSVIQAFYVEGLNFMIQEYIEEAAGGDIRAIVIGNRVVASMKRQSLTDDFRSNIHLGGEGSKVKLSDEEKRTAIKAAKAMGLSICGVDLIQSHRGPLVLEVNSSPGLKGIETATGRDIATKIIEYIEHNAKRKQSKDKVGA
jgi:ribosomal protein S6--L-glutamate ligase